VLEKGETGGYCDTVNIVKDFMMYVFYIKIYHLVPLFLSKAGEKTSM
jgi:hypothetical protein